MTEEEEQRLKAQILRGMYDPYSPQQQTLEGAPTPKSERPLTEDTLEDLRIQQAMEAGQAPYGSPLPSRQQGGSPGGTPGNMPVGSLYDGSLFGGAGGGAGGGMGGGFGTITEGGSAAAGGGAGGGGSMMASAGPWAALGAAIIANESQAKGTDRRSDNTGEYVGDLLTGVVGAQDGKYHGEKVGGPLGSLMTEGSRMSEDMMKLLKPWEWFS